MTFDPYSILRQLFERAVETADPMASLAGHLPTKPHGRVVVIGAGKASARMAEAVEQAWGPCEGLVITRYGYGRPTKGIEIVEAAHPVPDQAGQAATMRLLALLDGLDESTFVLCLISGGASALLTAPVKGMTAQDKQDLNAALLASGAPISKMNVVRKHASHVKGGQLAARAYPAQMLTLMISDVPGDDPAHIGSGPTVGEDSTPQDAIKIIDDWDMPVAQHIREAILANDGVVGRDHPKLTHTKNHIYAAPSQSLSSAAELAKSKDMMVEIIDTDLEGEARDVATTHAALVAEKLADKGDDRAPLLLLSGGELTVTRRGNGIGGPNAEYSLALALALDAFPEAQPRVFALACDTDGVDGAAEVAGAYIDPDSLARARAKGVDPKQALQNNDAHRFFEAIDGQIITGPTLTNVNDFRAILIL